MDISAFISAIRKLAAAGRSAPTGMFGGGTDVESGTFNKQAACLEGRKGRA